MPNEGSYEAAVRRSDEIQADLAEHAGKYNMLTGDRPTGRLHLGHYFGTIVERVRLQNLGVHTNIIIADSQVITDRDTTEHIADWEIKGFGCTDCSCTSHLFGFHENPLHIKAFTKIEEDFEINVLNSYFDA